MGSHGRARFRFRIAPALLRVRGVFGPHGG
jgi:hypothetical protein